MFVDPNDFPIAAELEANWTTIRDEFMALPKQSFDPWVQRSMHGEGWSVFGLFAAGFKIPGAAKLCPRTVEIIESFGNVGLAGFSRMAPHTHILPHQGWATNEYRLHLGLVVPDGCRLKVRDETRHWRAGECLIFDDTAMHEAWNDSDEFRGNLMVDFLRPGQTEFSVNNVPPDVRKYAEGLFGDED